MPAFASTQIGARVVAVAAAALLSALLAPKTALAQILPWEIVVAEIETGRLRSFAERLAKQNLTYQLRLGDTPRSEILETVEQIDRILESLAQGRASYSIPAPWTAQIREQIRQVEEAWEPVRSVATASPYENFRAKRQFMPAEQRGQDPLLLRYFDNTTANFIAESEKLLGLYDVECRKTGLEVCPIAKTTGINAMLIERAARKAVYLVAGIDVKQNRDDLTVTLDAYRKRREANEKSAFFAEALNPERSISAAAGAELLVNLRADWDAIRKEFQILAAGDETNFDLKQLLTKQTLLVEKVERLTTALVRYASLTYGA